MPRRPAATQENNAWRSRKRVVADYVPECMHHHVNDLSILPASSTAGAAGCAASAACGASACAVVYCTAAATLPRSTARPLGELQARTTWSCVFVVKGIEGRQ